MPGILADSSESPLPILPKLPSQTHALTIISSFTKYRLFNLRLSTPITKRLHGYRSRNSARNASASRPFTTPARISPTRREASASQAACYPFIFLRGSARATQKMRRRLPLAQERATEREAEYPSESSKGAARRFRFVTGSSHYLTGLSCRVPSSLIRKPVSVRFSTTCDTSSPHLQPHFTHHRLRHHPPVPHSLGLHRLPVQKHPRRPLRPPVSQPMPSPLAAS